MERPKSLDPLDLSYTLCAASHPPPPTYQHTLSIFWCKTCRYVFLIFIICLVSPWYFTAVAQNVVFPDANLAAEIRTELRLAEGADITQADLAQLIFLYPIGIGVTDLTGLENATNLQYLSLAENPIGDFTAIRSLTNLVSLNLFDTGLSDSDMPILTPLVNLRTLHLAENPIGDFTPISSLTNLTSLFLYGTGFSDSDIPILAPLVNLRTLQIGNNRITNLSALVTVISDNMPNLRSLDINDNGFRDITPLTELKDQLTKLNLRGIRISNFNPLAELTNLTDLWIQNTGISNLEPLRNLVSLQYLYLNNNNISNLEPLSGLTNLRLLWMYCNPFAPVPNPFETLRGLGLTRSQSVGVDNTYETQAKAVFGDNDRVFRFRPPCPEPEPEPEPESELESEWEPKIKRRRSTTRCGLGWSPQVQYQPWEELYKVMIYALEFEYDPEGHQKFICKTIEIRTGDDAIENLAGWKLYLGTRYNPSYIPLTIPEEHGQITGRILRLTPEMFGREAFPCNTVNTISHPLPGVRYDLKTDENVLVDIAYSCFIYGQIAYTTVNGQNVESPRRISSAALREMETPRLERYIPNNTGIYITYMDLEAFTWDRAVLSDWLLPASASSVAGAPSVIRRKAATTWGTLKKQ